MVLPHNPLLLVSLESPTAAALRITAAAAAATVMMAELAARVRT
jgi:hypothetical protein